MGRFNGCQAVIRRQHPLAVPMHCFNHRLNLAVSKSCDVPAVRNMFGMMNRICDFILSSPKRVKEMEELIDAREEGGRQRRLRMYCATRWVDSHDSVLVFLDLLPVVVDTLNALAHVRGAGATGADAAALLTVVRSSGFLVSLQVAGHCLAKTVSLSRALQDPSQNIGDAIARVMAVRKAFEDERVFADEEFHRVFFSASEMAEKIGEELTAPRNAGRQTHRANAPAEGTEEYYRRNIFIPFLDHLINELKVRFGDDVPKQVRLQELMPAAMNATSLPRIMEAAELFEFDLNRSLLEVEAEVKTWMNLIQSLPQERRPKDIPEAILLGKDNFLPAVTTLLRLFGTIPVSNATAERSFSALKRLKTYLRSTMGEERLTGLALLHINKSTEVDPDEIIEIYAGKKERRIRLV
jgi:hAT family C-terminal dimerisation region